MRDGMEVRANVLFVLRDRLGREVDRWELHNTVKTAGKEGAADQLLASPTLPKPGWIAIGTSTPGATLLGAEIHRHALTSKTRSGAIVTMVADFAAGHGTGTITEAGLFDVVTDNTVNMWLSATFTAKEKTAEQSLQVTWTLTFSGV